MIRPQHEIVARLEMLKRQCVHAQAILKMHRDRKEKQDIIAASQVELWRARDRVDELEWVLGARLKY